MNSTFTNINKFITPLGSSLILQVKQSIETYKNNNSDNSDNVEKNLTKKQQIINTIYYVSFIILGLFCAVLCWRVNTNTFFLLKLLYVLFAYFFGPVYIIYYILYYYIFLKFIKKSNDIYSYNNTKNIYNNATLNNTKLTNTKLTNIPNTYIADNISINK